jgi:ABC-type transport system involved in cytochrome c biogenesis ATPase subunit
MLHRLGVENFKAIGPRVELDLAPLTVLVGPNGAGKSTLLQAIALTAQSATQQEHTADLVLNGPLVDLAPELFRTDPPPLRGVAEQVHHRGGSVGPMAVEIGFDMDPDALLRLGLPIEPPRGLGASPWPPVRVQYAWSREIADRDVLWGHRLAFGDNEVFAVRTTGAQRSGTRSVRQVKYTTELRFAGSVASSDEGASSLPRVLAPGMLGAMLLLKLAGSEEAYRVAAEATPALSVILDALLDECGRVVALNPMRGVHLVQMETGPLARGIGKFGDSAIRFYAASDRAAKVAVDRWADRFGLPGFAAQWSGATPTELAARFLDPWLRVDVPLWHAATGSWQALFIAMQLLLTPVGTVALIEEPEQNLHPEYEKLLAELFAEAVARGQQVILTTHSEILVASIANAVRRRTHGLVPEAVAVWHLERREADIEAARIGLTARGNLEHWVKSFAKVEVELAQEWTDQIPAASDAEPTPRSRSTRGGRHSRSGGRGR